MASRLSKYGSSLEKNNRLDPFSRVRKISMESFWFHGETFWLKMEVLRLVRIVPSIRRRAVGWKMTTRDDLSYKYTCITWTRHPSRPPSFRYGQAHAVWMNGRKNGSVTPKAINSFNQEHQTNREDRSSSFVPWKSINCHREHLKHSRPDSWLIHQSVGSINYAWLSSDGFEGNAFLFFLFFFFLYASSRVFCKSRGEVQKEERKWFKLRRKRLEEAHIG